MQSALFLKGTDRLQAGIDKGFMIALMCAEKDAATCHRSLLPGCFLSQKLPGRGINLLHISHKGALETQSELEQRLVDLHTMGEDLFMTSEESWQRPYQQQLKNTSYRRPRNSQ